MPVSKKLSVGKVLDMLRKNDAPERTRLAQLSEKIAEQDRTIQRLRAQRRRLKAGLPPDPE